MPKLSRTQILESRVRELTAQLAVATDILHDFRAMDDERACPFCAKDEWGEDKHEPSCIYARLYGFLQHSSADVESLLDLKAAVVDVCLALTREHLFRRRNGLEGRLETLARLVGLEPDPEPQCHPPETHTARKMPPYDYGTELKLVAHPQ